MEEITITYKTFSFDELSLEVQEEVLDKHRYYNVEHFDWWDACYDDMRQTLSEAGIEVDKERPFNFDFDRGQHVSFNGAWFDGVKFIEAAMKESNLRAHYPLIDEISNHLSITRSRRGEGQSIEVDLYPDPERLPRVTKLCDLIKNAMESYLQELERKFLKMLNEELKYLISDEAVKESLEANDMKFLENGKVFKG